MAAVLRWRRALEHGLVGRGMLDRRSGSRRMTELRRREVVHPDEANEQCPDEHGEQEGPLRR